MKLVWVAILLVTFKVTSCEDTDTNGRVINGSKAKSRQFPFFAQLTRILAGTNYETQNCGSSIITRRHVLTSAHCIYAEVYHVYAGNVQIRKDWSFRADQRVRVKRIVTHPDGVELADIAILELESPLNFTDTVQPIHVADKAFDRSVNVRDSECYVAGYGMWGYGRDTDFTVLNMTLATQFTYTDIHVMPRDACNFFAKMSIWDRLFKRANDLVCSLTPDGKGACYGDSGGPVFCRNKNSDDSFRLVGIPALLIDMYCTWGVNGHARVSNFRMWIARHLHG